MPLVPIVVNSLLVFMVFQCNRASLLATCAGLVGVNTITCILYKLLDSRSDLPSPSDPFKLPKATGVLGLASIMMGKSQGVADLSPASTVVGKAEERKGKGDIAVPAYAGCLAEARGMPDLNPASIIMGKAEGQETRKRAGSQTGRWDGGSCNGSILKQMNRAHTAGPAAAAGLHTSKAPARTLPHFQALALQTILDKGFGANLSSAVLHYSNIGPKRYPSVQVMQVNIKVRAKVSTSMLPPSALETLANLFMLQQRGPSFGVRSSAVRQGCILVTLDVQQLAGILSSVRQQRQQQRGNEGSEPPVEVEELEEQDCFRILQEHVAAAGQEWLHAVGLESSLQQGTLMSVQVLDCMHHFKWDAESGRWAPSGSDLVPFGCQHSVTTQSLVALLLVPDCSAPEQSFSLLPEQQGKQADEQVQQHQRCAPHSQWKSAGTDTTYVDLALDVCTCPGQMVMGWTGEEQEQQVNSNLGHGLNAVHLLARIEGVHVPVTVLGCEQAEEKESPAREYPKQKQVVHVRVACKNRPQMVQFELWQQHAILAPACGVLLLPAAMSAVAGEIDRQAATLKVIQVAPDAADADVDSWDCAAPDAAPALSSLSAGKHDCGGMTDFVADLGIWFETNSSTDAVEARCSLRPSEPTGCSTSYDSNTFSYEHAVCERRWGSTQGQQQQGPANPAHPPGPEQHDKSKLTDAMDLSRGLLQQAVAWGMPNLAELVLTDLMREPYSKSFVELANGTLPAPEGEQELGAEESYERYQSSEFSSRDDDVSRCTESLLNLALLSRSTDMMARVLAWGSKYGGRGFEWAWRAAGAHGITPLLRIQALCNTHRELLEMALADLHAGPGLLASWLQEGPRGLLPDPSLRFSFQLNSPSNTPPSAPASPAVEITAQAAPASGISPEEVEGRSRPAPSAAGERACSSSMPLAGPLRLAANRQATTQAAPCSTLQDRSRMRYWGWLLRCVVLGFPTSKLPDAVLQAHRAPVAGGLQQQQQQQQQPHQMGPEPYCPEEGFGVQEPQFRAWSLLRVAPIMSKMSIVLLFIPIMSFCISLGYTSAHGLRPCLCALPFYGGLALVTLKSVSVSSAVDKTVKPEALEAWLSVSQVLRAALFFLRGLDIIGDLGMCRFGLAFYMDSVMEIVMCYFEQVSFFRFIAARAVLTASFVPCYYISNVKHFIKRACALHGLCSTLW
eukprot:CAMPEP_0202376294 /NCGR_PEP_ID=MMETSP1127-20130417/6812_1 /ASSEMBLY_ACC=CAM_ASM_000462 /TAXON_ID=3047 /ORGANISM="Dunaliella tertiolecta, Strain CCMP1320" /LENGTH=1185 /DNA_ID=CAMNT_0048974037 /DNA_START=327 /DNA_END=3881 /DNA_ORIENTATION=+